jgi:transposase InsO family protein
LDRHFIVEELGTKWVSDITYIHTNQGWLYLTVILDLAERKLIGWALNDNKKTFRTFIPAWNKAIKNRPVQHDLLFHSDRRVNMHVQNLQIDLMQIIPLPNIH